MAQVARLCNALPVPISRAQTLSNFKKNDENRDVRCVVHSYICVNMTVYVRVNYHFIFILILFVFFLFFFLFALFVLSL